MNECPLLSVALATYNGAKYLPQLLESLSQQTLQPAEIIVFDDGSTDNTLAVLNQFIQQLPITIHVNDQPLGVVRNFKKAVSACRGQYIAFCDQDDIWLPDKLARSVEAIKKIDSPKPTMVYTDLIVVDEQLNKLAVSYWEHRKLKPAKESFKSLLYGNIITGCTMIINRAMAIEVRRMPDLVLMHDFWIGCVAYGVGRCVFINQPTVLYRQHASNVTNNDAVTWRTRWSRLYNFLLSKEQASHFLCAEINQARLFLSLYGHQLSLINRKALRQIIDLENNMPISRKWRTFLIKFLHIH
ncbi:glycosyltransferase family 2 protein [Fibrella forsythiae]|uniref:Glycosyltransferase family 2 protein n=1 Tax=Fibrella forsythiae TaxID=2817061 RepID=A0ABS3JGY8_9BACT|nr:glycosyltransferase family 2 protein [Fibrella forsythiae]MBO0949263.1 glycosyltransferase family 2 protein [Fibrella forsythiae]